MASVSLAEWTKQRTVISSIRRDNRFLFKISLYHSKVEQRPDACDLKQHYDRDAEHKFDVLGLMAYDEHRQKHRNRAAEGGEKQERTLARSVLRELFRRDLIVDRNDDRYDRYSGEIDQPPIILYKFGHNLPHFFGKLSLRLTTRLKVFSYFVSLQK